MMRVARTTMHGAVMKLSMWGDDAPLGGARTRTQGGRTPSSPFLEQWLPRRELLAADAAMGVASGAMRRRWAAPSSPSGRMYHTSSPLLTNRTPLSQEVENAKRKLAMAEAMVNTCHVAVAKAKLVVAGWELLEKEGDARLKALTEQMPQLCRPHAEPGSPEWQVLETYVATAATKTESTNGEKAKIEQLEKAEEKLEKAEEKLEKAKTELEKATTELKTAAARSVSLEMFRESVADGSKQRRNDLFLPFGEYPNAYALLDKILGILDAQVYQRGDYGILKIAELGSPRPFELCLLKETTDTDGVLLAVRAPLTNALQHWKATPPNALAPLEGEWTFLRDDCLASTIFTREKLPLVTKMAESIAPAMMGTGPVSIRDCLYNKREDLWNRRRASAFPTCLLDSEIFLNFRPEPRKLVDMSFEVVRKGDGNDQRSTTPEDIAKRLAEVHALFFSAASGSGKTAAMFALLKMLEAEHRKEGVTTIGLTSSMKDLGPEINQVTQDAPETRALFVASFVASYVAKRLVEALDMPPTGRGYEVKGLRVVLLVDEAGPYPEFARALGAASATRNPTGDGHSTTLSDAFHKQLQLQLKAKGWQPHADGIEKDSLRLLVAVAGTGVGRTTDGTSLPDGVLLGTFQETNPFEVMGEMVDSAFAAPRFSEESSSIPPGTTTIDAVSLRDAVVEAVKSEETLRMFAESNLRCAALLGEILARHCYCLPSNEFNGYVARNVLLLVSLVSRTYVRSNGWAQYPNQGERKRLAKLVLSLFATVPDGYHLLTADDLQKLVRELGAVEDCATRITGGSKCGNAIEGKNRKDMEGVPAWGTLCYPNVESTNATTWYLPTNRRTTKQYRLRVDPALLIVCVSILGHQIVPTTKEPSPQLYEIFVFAMTEALAFAHGEAAARYFKDRGGEQRSVPPDVIWPWLPKGVYGAKCVVTMSATRHRVESHEDQLEETGKYESHPESDPVRSSDTISRLLGLCPPAPPTSPTSPEAGCAMVVELAARNAAQSDVVVHTATGSIGMECKEFVNGDPISFDVLVKRAGAMGYGRVVVELPKSAFHFSPTEKIATVTDRAVSSLLAGRKKQQFTKLVWDTSRKGVYLRFSAEDQSSAVVNRMLRSMLLRKAREESQSNSRAAAATVPRPRRAQRPTPGNAMDPLAEDVVVLVAPLKGLLPKGSRVWFEDLWRLVAAPTEAGTPPTAASTTRGQFSLDGIWILKRPFVETTTIDFTTKKHVLHVKKMPGTELLLAKKTELYPQNRRVNVVCTQLSLLEYARRLVDKEIETTLSNKTKTLGKGNNEGGTQPLQL